MGESALTLDLRSEAEFTACARRFAGELVAARAYPLVLGLRGDLGSGKTTWVRAMLRGLGYRGRVPSPTYTLLEQYACDGLTVVHLDLYRLSGDEELENLGLRDWLAERAFWLLIEWPERAPQLAKRCDLTLELSATGPDGRRLTITPKTPAAIEALEAFRHASFNKGLQSSAPQQENVEKTTKSR
jgi:tRNA threonylcarbamoyladenosine biosynthesis protein TsaE